MRFDVWRPVWTAHDQRGVNIRMDAREVGQIVIDESHWLERVQHVRFWTAITDTLMFCRMHNLYREAQCAQIGFPSFQKLLSNRRDAHQLVALRLQLLAGPNGSFNGRHGRPKFMVKDCPEGLEPFACQALDAPSIHWPICMWVFFL